ncbi:MAG: hypothetical protein ACR2P4_09375 [Gammaproteobacteria bacterium]
MRQVAFYDYECALRPQGFAICGGKAAVCAIAQIVKWQRMMDSRFRGNDEGEVVALRQCGNLRGFRAGGAEVSGFCR